MFRLDGYEIRERLRFAEKTQVYTAVRATDGLHVVIKIYPRDRAVESQSQAQHEFDVLEHITACGVPRAVEVHKGGERPALVLEQLPGMNLSQFSRGEALQIGLFLEIAQRIASILRDVHAAGVIHRDIKPSNIMVDPGDLAVAIIDFGIAIRRDNTVSTRASDAPSQRAADAQDLRERGAGTLAYIAPEQTGRMDRQVDLRSDLYSLGILFYEMLTGRLPFRSSDPLELIHAHIAQVAEPVDTVEPSVPAGLARLVAKLIEKEPERRYQTCAGLLADLARCEELWRTQGDVGAELELGLGDRRDELCFGERLYGRESELEELERCFARVRDGGSGIVLLSGPAGSGKSSLARAMLPRVLDAGGRFVQGGFDAYRSEQSLLGFAQVLSHLAEQVLTEGAQELEAWRDRLRVALGGIGRVVIDLVPELEPLLPDMSPVPPLGPEQTRRRLIIALRRFFSAFGQDGQPLVILLEDMHDADPESLALLEELVIAPKHGHTLVIATCRAFAGDAPARASRADSEALRRDLTIERLRSLLEQAQRTDRIGRSIDVRPLAESELLEWIRDLLALPPATSESFCTRVIHTTGGIPFLVRQYLNHLVDLHVLTRDRASDRWQLDADALDSAAVPDDVAGLLTLKLDALGPQERELLGTACLLGDTVDRDAMRELCSLDAGELERLVRDLCGAGLWVSDESGLRFAHGRIREAAHSMASDAERSRRHHAIGRWMLARTEPAQLPDAAPAIMQHLNQAPEHMTQEERPQQILLNVMAGARSLSAGNPSIAERFLERGLAQFADGDWDTLGNLGFELHTHGAEAAFANTRSERALALLAVLEARPLDPIQTARVFGRRATIRALTEGPEHAVQEGVAGLKRLGWRWSVGSSKARLYVSILRAWWELGRIDETSKRISMGSMPPEALASTILLSHVAAACYRYSLPLFAHTIAISVPLHRRYEIPVGLGILMFSVAHLQASLTGNYARAYEIGQRAKQASEREIDPRFSALALINEHILINPWVKHRRNSIEPLRRAEHLGQEIGEVEHTVYAAFYRCLLLYLVGEPLPTVIRSLEELIASYRTVVGLPMHEHLVAAFQTLAGVRAFESDDVQRAVDAADDDVKPMVATVWMGILYTLKSYALALETAEPHLRYLIHTPPSQTFVPEFWFMRGLAAASLLRTEPDRKRRERRRIAHRSLRRMQHYARHGPDNFAHQVVLLEGELAMASGRRSEALVLYGRAAEGAQEHGYHQHAALAFERRAEWYIAGNQPRDASSELGRALDLYATWGAELKTSELLKDHKELLQDYPILNRSFSQPTTTTTTQSQTTRTGFGTRHGMTESRDPHSLDLTALLRASEALSGELKFEGVLDRVMNLAIETAGAQRACLLLAHGDHLFLEAERTANQETVRHAERPALEHCGELLPIAVIRYVQRARKTKVVGRATADRLFQEDAYVEAHDSKSILAVPILRQTRLVGVLYLENELVPNAFSPNSVDVLGLLSTHAAISLHNARLYDELRSLNLELEQRVEARTLELRSARDAAQSADRAKGEFLAVMSHEIRTPMNVVIGMAQLLEDTPLESDQRECVQAVRTAGNSLLALINDILDFSKIEAGKLELERISFSLRECVEEVVEILAPKAHERGLEFPAWIDRSLPATLLGDPVRIKQVMINFVNNALKFTEAGEVRIELRVIDGARIRVEVHDSGIGIPADRIDRLFQRFSQVDVSTTRKYGGTGLGLAICKGLIEAMQGRVGVESQLGTGSTFWFEIPMWLPPGESSSARALDLSSVEIAIALEHASSAEGLREQLASLGNDARVYTRTSQLMQDWKDRPAGPATPRILLTRYPIEHAAFADWLRGFAAQPDQHALVMPSLQARPDAEAALADLQVGLLTWPVKLSNLERALAVALGAASAIEEADAPSSSDAVLQAGRARIIVAEDYPLNQKLIVRLLKRFGYTCDVVDNGQMLVEATDVGTYDLALIDCQMPVMDGFEATRQIRAREAQSGEHLPIVAMTANAMKGDRERCLECGMDDYLSKPIHLESLRGVLRKFLDQALTDDA